MAFLEGCGRETHRRLFGAKECANTFRGGMKDLKKTNKQNKTKKRLEKLLVTKYEFSFPFSGHGTKEKQESNSQKITPCSSQEANVE